MNVDGMNAKGGGDVVDDSVAPGDGGLVSLGIREIIIVDSHFDRYDDFVASASNGDVGLHFCNDGLSALKLSRRFRGDIWLVSTELPDMAGFDLLPILLEHVQQGGVDPLLGGSRISLDSRGNLPSGNLPSGNLHSGNLHSGDSPFGNSAFGNSAFSSGFHPGVFMVSDRYRIEEEQRALSCGSAGYLVRPVTLDLVKALRTPDSGCRVSSRGAGLS